jgi:predicted deacylase
MADKPTYTVSRIPVSTLGSGHELSVVVHRLEGTSSGPTIGITGGIHGDETDTVEYVRRFLELMKEQQFSGSILAVSCGNPLAYESRTRNTPTDMIDLNRVFPGDPNGLLTHQLANKIFEVFADECQYFVDIHCGGIFPTVDYVYLHGDEGMARSAGSKVLYVGASYEGSLAFSLEKRGLHTTVIELGGGRVNGTPAAERAGAALGRILTYAGILPGGPEPVGEQIVVDQMATVRPHHGGMLLSGLSLSQLGTILPKGVAVGTVVQPQTLETLEVLTTPFNRSVVVLAREAFSPISVGDYGFMFGREAATRD